MFRDVAINFLIGGTVTALIVGLEQSGHRYLSALATLVPVFTVVSYIFIGNTKGGEAVATHSKFVLIGTLISWVPYMMVVSMLAPKFGPNKAIGAGLIIFFILAVAFIGLSDRLKWFQ